MKPVSRTRIVSRIATLGHCLLGLCLLGLCLLGLLPAGRAAAHEGPPYPVLVDQRVGPRLVSLWGDPDIGTATFFVVIEPLEDRALPASAARETFAL